MKKRRLSALIVLAVLLSMCLSTDIPEGDDPNPGKQVQKTTQKTTTTQQKEAGARQIVSAFSTPDGDIKPPQVP